MTLLFGLHRSRQRLNRAFLSFLLRALCIFAVLSSLGVIVTPYIPETTLSEGYFESFPIFEVFREDGNTVHPFVYLYIASYFTFLALIPGVITPALAAQFDEKPILNVPPSRFLVVIGLGLPTLAMILLPVLDENPTPFDHPILWSLYVQLSMLVSLTVLADSVLVGRWPRAKKANE